jgi:type VII secretion protein EccE
VKTQRALGIDRSWPRVTCVLLIDLAVLVVASRWPIPQPDARYAWWAGISIAVLVTLLGLMTHQRTTVAAIPLRWVLDRFVDTEAALDTGQITGVDHLRRFGRSTVGIRAHQDQLVSVIAVGPAPELSSRHRGSEHSRATLPVSAVAAGLRQFDVRLSAIDIVSVTRRRTRTEEMSGSEATWLILRFDATDNTAAIALRDSVASTLAAVSERLAGDINGRRCSARPLTMEEIARVDVDILAGLHPGGLRVRRRQLQNTTATDSTYVASSFWLTPRDITSSTLELLQRSTADTTVTTIRLVPDPGRGVAASVVVRLHREQPPSKSATAGLNRLGGQQLAAVRAGLPIPTASAAPTVPARRLEVDDDLEVPLGSASPAMTAVGAHR